MRGKPAARGNDQTGAADIEPMPINPATVDGESTVEPAHPCERKRELQLAINE